MYMKKTYLSAALLLSALCGTAQTNTGEVKLTVNKQYNETIDLWITPVEAGEGNVQVSWGDDEDIQSYTIDPEASDYYKKVSGTYKGGEGDTIRIYGAIRTLDCSDGRFTSVTLADQPQMEQLRANKNEITYEGCILDGAPNLTILDLSENQLTMLDVRMLTKLQYLTAYDNPQLSTVFFAPEGETFESIEQISLSGCDISHFYPVHMPNLSALTLSGGSLMELEIGGYYPSLSSLDVEGNYIQTIDVSLCPALNTLNVTDNLLTEINVSQNPALTGLFCSNNQIKELNLSGNPTLNNLSCSNNGIEKLDVSMLPQLEDLTCDSNRIARLDFHNNTYLRNLSCRDNLLEFLDFSTNGGRLNKVDCRGNELMSACALNYMFSTMPAREETAYYENLFVEGCDWETADMSEITSTDMKWMSDVKGDGTADCGEVAITLQPAANGTYTLEQAGEYGVDYHPITDKAEVGVPIRVVAVPDADYAFESVSVNGVAVADTFFVVREASEIAVNFRSTLQPYITFDVAEAGQELTISLGAVGDDTPITIDWGDGQETPYVVNAASAYIDGMAAGTTVKITGEVNHLDIASFPGVGWENNITGLDVSHNDRLVYLETYMNPIKILSVENCPDLEYLNCAYSELTELNVSDNPKLAHLICYGNTLTTLDVSGCPELVELDAKENALTTLDVTNNPKLVSLNTHNNQLTALDVTGLADLEELEAGMNQLTTLDVTHNPLLWSLAVSDNQLTSLDVTHNPQLVRLLCANNKLATLDLGAQASMSYIDCAGNGMTACALNDFYFNLPPYEKPESSQPGMETFSLWVLYDADATPNDATHAEHLIATSKGWTVNQEGDGTGCDEVYVVATEAENGTVRLFNNETELPAAGGKVTKDATVSVIAEPATGYELSSLRANGQDVLAAGEFVASRFTEVVARFALKGSGIDNVESRIMLLNVHNGLQVLADTDVLVSVYAPSGVLLQRHDLSGNGHIALEAGAYIVSLETADRQMTKSVVIW